VREEEGSGGDWGGCGGGGDDDDDDDAEDDDEDQDDYDNDVVDGEARLVKRVPHSPLILTVIELASSIPAGHLFVCP
jgi:hypothetical protein